jgi:hypothetical protein
MTRIWLKVLQVSTTGTGVALGEVFDQEQQDDCSLERRTPRGRTLLLRSCPVQGWRSAQNSLRLPRTPGLLIPGTPNPGSFILFKDEAGARRWRSQPEQPFFACFLWTLQSSQITVSSLLAAEPLTSPEVSGFFVGCQSAGFTPRRVRHPIDRLPARDQQQAPLLAPFWASTPVRAFLCALGSAPSGRDDGAVGTRASGLTAGRAWHAG